MAESQADSYWYDERSERERAREVLEALRTYRAAERAMRRRTRDEMSMGENELLALRYLFRQPGHVAQPVALVEYLGISPAATSVLIDRLERSGHVQREQNAAGQPATVRATAHADEDVRQTLGRMHELMYAVAAGMDAQAQANVTDFLRAMADAVDGVDSAVADRAGRSEPRP
ncbi:MarR family transcriptional regulator [Microbacterium sp.]|uniref:MarR family winged helix-turn-helix transcriptional regulator n=1 Tax=Microbacterium sp. TaxID=51671 RepID=UPI0028B0E91E|nr:MarR family transcriptional regulator [Microbacterium sp.]